jgi:hypothetical protein
MDFAGGIWAFWNILVPSTALSIQEFKKRSQKPEIQDSGDAGYGVREIHENHRLFLSNP